TLHLKHRERRDPGQWRGMKLAVPFEYSMHNLLLRYYLAEHGLDPDRDVEIRIIPPAWLVAALRSGSIDGYLGPEPFNQRAVHDGVGFIHALSDGQGNGRNIADRAIFAAFPWHSMAVWILTQLKRWGYVKGDLDYHAVAEEVFLATDARKRLAQLGLAAPERTYAQHRVMGRPFDPARPEEYVRSFHIPRSSP